MALALGPLALLASATLIGWVIGKIPFFQIDLHLHDVYVILTGVFQSAGVLLTIICGTVFVARRHRVWGWWLTGAICCVAASVLSALLSKFDRSLTIGTFYPGRSDGSLQSLYLAILSFLALPATAMAFVRTFQRAFLLHNWNVARDTQRAAVVTMVGGILLAVALGFLWIPWAAAMSNVSGLPTSNLSEAPIAWTLTVMYACAPLIVVWRLTGASSAKRLATSWRWLYILVLVLLLIAAVWGALVGEVASVVIGVSAQPAIQIFFLSGALAMWLAHPGEQFRTP